MVTWCKKLVLLLALAVVPLQGIAAAAADLHCLADVAGHAPHMMHTQDGHGHDHDMNHDGHPGGNDGTHAAGHFCFHHFVSALPVVKLPAATPDHEARVSTSHVFHDLFVADRAQRPPLA